VVLRIEDIRVHYGVAEALHGLSLNIPKGTVVSVIGSNGAGKSTLLRTIVGLNTPSSGEIWFQDERIDRMQAHSVVKLGVALVPEGRKLFPFMTVLENLRLGAYVRIDSREEIRKGLEIVFHHFPRLKERKKQKAGTLSGGEQQMLTIGRALMAKPVLLLMDEPSLGLAPLLVREIAKVISDINKKDITILLAEQNSFIAFELADRIHILENGKNIVEGTPGELVKNEDVKRAYLGR